VAQEESLQVRNLGMPSPPTTTKEGIDKPLIWTILELVMVFKGWNEGTVKLKALGVVLPVVTDQVATDEPTAIEAVLTPKLSPEVVCRACRYLPFAIEPALVQSEMTVEQVELLQVLT